MSIIRELRKKKGMSQKELADACCVHQTAVSQWEKGRTTPDLNSLKMLSEVLGVSVEALIGTEKNNDENRIRGFEQINAENISQRLGRSEHFALVIADESMMPTLKPGDTVIINRNMPASNGDIVAVTVGNGNAIIKRIIKKDTSILLVSDNSEYEPMVFSYGEFYNLPVSVLGRVIEMRRRF
ncbi:MAG: LexA family transcriptional regulator [Clostridia bacterium]|nr:LexA family transcriptional regulator [Clostridia bacterium]